MPDSTRMSKIRPQGNIKNLIIRGSLIKGSLKFKEIRENWSINILAPLTGGVRGMVRKDAEAFVGRALIPGRVRDDGHFSFRINSSLTSFTPGLPSSSMISGLPPLFFERSLKNCTAASVPVLAS